MSHAAEIATGQPFIAPMVWVMAGLIAALYLLVDRSLMRARRWAQGRVLARERGFGPAQPRRVVLTNAVFGALAGMVRLGLVLAVAAFCAMSFVLWWWASDIDAEQSAALARENESLRLRIVAEADRDIAAVSAEADRLERAIKTRTALATIEAEAAAKAAAGSRLPLQQRLNDLDRRIAVGRDAIDCAERTAEAELDAQVVTCTGEAVAVKGDGPR